MSQQAAWDAIKAAVDARFATPRVLDVETAANQTADHIVLFVSRRYVPDQLGSGEVTIKGGRTVLRSVCKSPENASVFYDRIEAALEDKILPGDFGPFVFESSLDVDADDGWFVTEHRFTY